MNQGEQIISLTEAILAKHIIFAEGKMFRPKQAELIRRLIEHRFRRWPTSSKDKVNPHAPLLLQQARTGLGKSLAMVFSAGVAAQFDLRTVIANSTRALRNQLFQEVDDANAALKEAYRVLELPPPKTIKMAELISPTELISRTRVEAIHRSVSKSVRLTDAQREEYDEFYTFVRDFPEERVRFHDWYFHKDGKALPIELTQASLWIDVNSDPQVIKDLERERKIAFDADILIVTHSMLRRFAWKLRSLDFREQRGTEIDPDTDCGAYDALLIDEAHNFPQIIRGDLTQIIDLDVILEILEEAPSSLDTSDAVAKLTAVRDHVVQVLNGRPVFLVNNAGQFHRYIDFTVQLLQALEDLLVKARDSLFVAHLEAMMASLAVQAAMSTRSGAGGQEFFSYFATDIMPVFHAQNERYWITLRPGGLGRSISSLWRRSATALNVREFKSVVMLSGTLSDARPDPSDPYGYFRREIGAFTAAGDNREVIWFPPLETNDTGRALQIVFADRSDAWRPILNAEVNPAHTDNVVRTLLHIYDHPSGMNNRVLALFMSEKALAAADTALKRLRPKLAEHIIAQHAGTQFLGKPQDRFRQDDKAILLSMNWQGINAVDADDRSLVAHLVLTKIPFMSGDERLFADAGRGATRANFHQAAWLLRQGLGRAGRDPSARYTVWLLDSRIPLPDDAVPDLGTRFNDENMSPFLEDLYSQFDQIWSRRLFGQGESRTGLLGDRASIGYVSREGNQIVVTEKKVMLTPRLEDVDA